jgi:hypothetical protein
MPLIQREKKEKFVPLKVNIESRLLARFESYCEYLESSKGHVVQAALEYIIERDKDYQKHIESGAKSISKPTVVVQEKRGA